MESLDGSSIQVGYMHNLMSKFGKNFEHVGARLSSFTRNLGLRLIFSWERFLNMHADPQIASNVSLLLLE